MRGGKEDAGFIFMTALLFFYVSITNVSAFVLPKYDFSYVSDVNVTAFADYMVDSNNDGLNDSLRISIELNSSKLTVLPPSAITLFLILRSFVTSVNPPFIAVSPIRASLVNFSLFSLVSVI